MNDSTYSTDDENPGDLVPDGGRPNGTSADETERIGVGRCPEHGIVTEDDGAEVHFPTGAECYCGRELDRATVADAEEVRSRV